ncbi:DUF1450 domain-containing protein [Alicyclobacillus sp. SO9]|uniref:DUF1450 domain-containing protein n=1 Tax=Alicyclobacillus sp. SO9 TaxID=2665646 RepID=UPI0018E78C8D|nr:DUF1450 domain-containing protein [Alicyclobacillus sp. SO9]QQE76890.1 DUF1450 domain-containing protein [Alicyclobacillus sp. SO9]
MASSMSMKWCKKNLEHHSQSVYDLLKEEYPDVEMKVEDCVDVCGLCTDVPFVLRNNAIIAARDPRGLYIKLKQGMAFLEEETLPGTYAAAQDAAAEDSASKENQDEASAAKK